MKYLIICTASLLIGCTSFNNDSIHSTELTSKQSKINAIRKLQMPYGYIDIPCDSDMERPSPLDISQYFNILTHISMLPGYSLEYVYRSHNVDPCLYARKYQDRKYDTYLQLLTDLYGGNWDTHFIFNPSPFLNPKWLNFIQTDGTTESYFELLVLVMMGEQFDLFWHARYNDHQIICDKSGFKHLNPYPTIEDYDEKLPERVIDAARKIDFTPRIIFKDDQVTVSVICFSAWGGFYRLNWTINKEFPHILIDMQIEELVPYDCGVMF